MISSENPTPQTEEVPKWPALASYVSALSRLAEVRLHYRRAGEAPGAPHAFDASADGWHVATTDGIHRSTDEGRTWSRVIEAETG